VRKRNMVAGVVAGGVVALDLLTKSWALEALAPGRSVEGLGSWIPFTLAFNQGAAFGLTIGDDPRWIFVPITILAAIFLVVLIHRARSGDHLRVVSSALVLGGALGNLYDRVRWDRGVVDFIGPIDLGFMHWPIFNVADMAITTGAILLAISFWTEEEQEEGEEAAVQEELPAGRGSEGTVAEAG
jgi:signal peptidase II